MVTSTHEVEEGQAPLRYSGRSRPGNMSKAVSFYWTKTQETEILCATWITNFIPTRKAQWESGRKATLATIPRFEIAPKCLIAQA